MLGGGIPPEGSILEDQMKRLGFFQFAGAMQMRYLMIHVGARTRWQQCYRSNFDDLLRLLVHLHNSVAVPSLCHCIKLLELLLAPPKCHSSEFLLLAPFDSLSGPFYLVVNP